MLDKRRVTLLVVGVVIIVADAIFLLSTSSTPQIAYAGIVAGICAGISSAIIVLLLWAVFKRK
jgi:Na+/melibiose symporter-like transporter